MHNFKELRIWKEAMELSKIVYAEVKKFPKSDRYELGAQLNKSAISIPSNIAEGAGRKTKPDFSNFISIATGSSFELETQLLLAQDFELISQTTLQPVFEKLTSLQKMMNKFKETLDTKS